MSFEVGTAGATSYLRRTSGLNYNAAYTVLFCYYSTGSHSSDYLWALSGATGSGSGAYPSASYADRLRFVGGGALWLDVMADPSFTSIAGPSLTSGWKNIAVVRSSATSIKLRIDASNYTGSTGNVGTREAVSYEFALNNTNTGEPVPTGSRITNYKSWSAALSDAEVDAEFASTAFTLSTNKYSGSPMGSESDNAVNDDADGSGVVWTYGAGISAGTNNPGVTYGSGATGVPKSTKFLMMGIG